MSTKVEFDMAVPLPPETLKAMLLDFTPNRPNVWPGLWSEAYEVYSVGETSAEIREGNKSPKIWAREHYDWSTPGVVRWTVVESNFCAPGSYVEVRMAPQNGGSALHVTWERTPTTFLARLIFVLIKLTNGAPVRSSLNSAVKAVKT
jgi:hypothetical protein